MTREARQLPAPRREAQSRAVARDAVDRRLLVKANAPALRGDGEALGQLRWMHCCCARREKRAQGKRAAEHFVRGLAIERSPVLDADTSRGDPRGLDLPCVRFSQRESQLSDAREFGVDRLALDKALHLVQVLARELRQPARFAFAEVGDGEGVRVVERLADDSGVSSRGAVGDPLGFEEDDLLLRRQLLEEEGGPEAGVAAADDRDVGDDLAAERRPRRARRPVGEPEAAPLDRWGVSRDGAPGRPRRAIRRAPRGTDRAAGS